MNGSDSTYWFGKLFNYCERGSDAGFWAEPINALTNLGFLIAALSAGLMISGKIARSGGGGEGFRYPGPQMLLTLSLIVMVAIIGCGSFLFHTFASRWASLGDVLPIGLFMLGYLYFALRYLLGLTGTPAFAGVVLFAAACVVSAGVTCGGRPCLNGSVGYLPALIALLGIGLVLWKRGDRAYRWLLGAGVLFLLSLSFRSLDMAICSETRLAGHVLGTHFIWHLLNALLLYLLLRAAIERLPPAPGALD